MFCDKCDNSMKRISTESNRTKEVWRCRKCGYQEDLTLYPPAPKKAKKKWNTQPQSPQAAEYSHCSASEWEEEP